MLELGGDFIVVVVVNVLSEIPGTVVILGAWKILGDSWNKSLTTVSNNRKLTRVVFISAKCCEVCDDDFKEPFPPIFRFCRYDCLGKYKVAFVGIDYSNYEQDTSIF